MSTDAAREREAKWPVARRNRLRWACEAVVGSSSGGGGGAGRGPRRRNDMGILLLGHGHPLAGPWAPLLPDHGLPPTTWHACWGARTHNTALTILLELEPGHDGDNEDDGRERGGVTLSGGRLRMHLKKGNHLRPREREVEGEEGEGVGNLLW